MARSLAQWLEWQQHQHPRAIDLGLDRVRSVAHRMGLLPLRVPAAIVAGTNGKGSTATTLASLLSAAGLRTGLFTSPHLVRYNERIQLDGHPIDDASLCAAFERIADCAGDTSLTFFEFNALAALEVFTRSAAQAVVLEVGLGGRLDATNIVDADVAVLCSVGMDHTDWLGDSLELIGREKAGVFRTAQRVVLGTSALPASVFEIATVLGCATRVADKDFGWSVHPDGNWRYDLHGPSPAQLEPLPAPQLTGDIQYRNAAMALTAWYALHEARPEAVPVPSVSTVHEGLSRVSLPGRMQVLARGAEWVLDVAHNVPAAEVFAAALRKRGPARRTIAIFGMLGDKDISGVVRVLDGLVDEWWLCPTVDGRGLDAAQLALRMGSTRGVRRHFASVEEASAQALTTGSADERVLVCGSFHVVGPALRCLEL